MEDELDKLQAIFGKVQEVETYFDVVASSKEYIPYIKVFIPDTPYQKKIPFLEEHKDDDIDVEDWTSNIVSEFIEDNLERSLRKTKTLISDYLLCNEFDLFATFTFSPKKTSDRFNPEVVKLQMANWLKNQRKRNGKFTYLIVPEFHKDGKALHFHALLNGYAGVLEDAGMTSKGRQLYNFKGYTLGWNSAVKIDNIEAVSSYVKKYITKDMPQFRGKRRFWATLGLNKPKVVDNPPNKWYLHATPFREFENEYGTTLFFTHEAKLEAEKEL